MSRKEVPRAGLVKAALAGRITHPPRRHGRPVVLAVDVDGHPVPAGQLEETMDQGRIGRNRGARSQGWDTSSSPNPRTTMRRILAASMAARSSSGVYPAPPIRRAT